MADKKEAWEGHPPEGNHHAEPAQRGSADDVAQRGKAPITPLQDAARSEMTQPVPVPNSSVPNEVMRQIRLDCRCCRWKPQGSPAARDPERAAKNCGCLASRVEQLGVVFLAPSRAVRLGPTAPFTSQFRKQLSAELHLRR